MMKNYSKIKGTNTGSVHKFLSKFLPFILLLFLGVQTAAQEIYDDFNSAGWTYVGNQNNRWRIGDPTTLGPYNGGKLMYISNSNPATANVPNNYTNSSSISHAYKTFLIPAGTTNMYMTFNWRANGETNYDYLRVWIVPNTYTPTQGTSMLTDPMLPSGNYFNLNQQGSFQNLTSTPINLTAYAGINIKIVLEWINDNSVDNQPPAAIDDITLSKYCSPLMGYPQYLYINRVGFIGTLNDVTNTSTYGTPTGDYNGYQNFTRLSNKAVQSQGEGINVSVQTSDLSRIKAWVDWNRNGNFEVGEVVYDTGTAVITSSALFGFVVPTTQPAGDYRIRIRNYRKDNFTSYSYPSVEACDILTSIRDEGESEDYLFTVLAKCAVKIATVTDGQRCGTGTVNVSATGSTGTTSIKWYAAPTGGVALGSSLPGANYPIVTTVSGEIYATAANATCENTNRVKVKYKIDPTPLVSFDVTTPEICGNQTAGIKLTAASDKESVHLIDEKFNVNLPTSAFTNVVAGTANINANWTIRLSTFVPANPPYFVVRPAIASGFDANRFVAAISDVNPGATTDMRLTQKTSVSAALFTNLSLEYDLYYRTSGKGASPTLEYANVEISTNGGTSWTTVKTYFDDYGIPNRFKHDLINLNSYAGQTNLKIRFVSYSYAVTNGWMSDIMALDNIELFGDRPLVANFTWTAPNIDIFAGDCVSPYVPGASACFKPNATQLENYTSWTINAAATLSNGCSANGTTTIQNNSKIWNTGASDWSTTNWKPATAVPAADKCVVIKTPVNVPAAYSAFAKTIKIETGGKLNVKPAGILNVTDNITSTANAADFIIENDGILLQTNNTANVGQATAQRYVTDMDNVINGPTPQIDYVYWSSPVSGQGLQTFSPGTTANRIYYYYEFNDKFYPVPLASEPNFLPAKGYAFRAETSGAHLPNPAGYSETYNFKGNLNNGDQSITINRSPDAGGITHGYNMIGNPYPSNISFDKLYTNNCVGTNCMIWQTAYFWTNNTYEPNQQQQNYSGNNYAVYNGSGGNSATKAASGTGVSAIPNGIVKVGQGIIVQKKELGSGTLQFKNSYGAGQDLRVSSAGTFFQKDANPKDRFWLKLKTPGDLINTQLIAYVEGATNDFDGDFDAEAFGLSSDVFYSILDDKKLLIQGRQSQFTDYDVVPVGANFFQDGNYTIALDSTEGRFVENQAIWLKDKVLNTYTNLSEGDYTFEASKGLTDGRFEIVYKNGTVLTTDSSTKNALEIFRDADDFVVRSALKDLTKVELFDASGRLILNLKGLQKEFRIPAQTIISGIFVVKATLKSGEVVSKKIRK